MAMSKHVNIRIASPADAEAVLAIYKPFVSDTVVTFEELVPSVDEFRQRMVAIQEESPFLVCEIDGRIVGYAYASAYRSRSSYRWNREVTVYIQAEFHGLRIGTALYYALIEISRQQNFSNLLAIITLPNPSSVGLHESLGFRAAAVFHRVGYKMNRWLDVGWWELNLQPDWETPQEPILFRDFNAQDFLNDILAYSSGMIQI